ncbi:septation protein SepH [Kribbella sp. NPDC051586]|uniref:septation protein SepH n=1 Tax=Kribbella sp. NPDC051586 TaxID=3364118 RepID=UPI00379E28E1
MREARLVGLSQDGKQLILAMAETGEEFAVPVDDRLRAALRGDRARLGQLEIQMESALRPRDIQARIRAGESPEAVAAIAQMPMERVMAFAGPVLAERDHIASLAQRASVRRRGGGDAPTRNLGAWVTDRLRTRQVDPASAEWDAWRREDGRWAVRVSYFVESEDEAEKKDEKIAMFAYDAPGRYAVPDDDEARWLVGEQAQVLATPVQPQPGERRLAAVADIDPLIAPDHGADSYEAGFEDTVGLRRRNHPVSRDAGDDARDGRDFGRENREFGRDPREVARDARDAGRDARDAGRERDFPREAGRSREPERGPRRVHSVPNPDEEPTLIDVPVDQPPAPRPAVRAVERPVDPPAFASPAAPDEAPAEARQPRPQQPAPAQPRGSEPRGSEPRRAEPAAAPAAESSRAAEARRQEPAREPAPHIEPDPVVEAPQPAAADASVPGAAEPAATEEAPAGPKKKPARRGKRASVPSWDEIMFGKKAD